MTAIAVIPARGGSKGVPGKNRALVGGRPLIVRAVAAARAATRVDRVLVSTDDGLIAELARAAGAEVVARPDELAGDTATSESALLHALDHAPGADVVALLQCTSPFLTPEDIDAVTGPVLDDLADSAFTAAPAHGFLWRPDGTGVNHDPAHRPRRQDRPVELLETGAAYAMRVDGLRRTGHRFFGRILPVPVDPARTLEIDEPADLERAARLASLFDADGPGPERADLDALVFDFDGTLTDDRVIVGQDGREAVTVHRGDGLAIAALRRAGLDMLILSTERNPVVAARAAKLQIPARHGIEDKGAELARWCAERGHAPERVGYVGNDVNDLPCFDIVGWPIAVADAQDAVRARARIVTAAPGGHGAVREIATRVLGRELHGSEPLAVHR